MSNKEKYRQLCELFGADLYYHHIQLPEWIYGLESVKKLTQGTLMRLYFPELLLGVDEILYLDCGIVVNTDVNPIWNIDVGNSPLAAVSDSDRPRFPRKESNYITHWALI